MADDGAPVGMRQYNANPDLYLMTQVQPRHGVNWAAHGRWVKVPGPFLPPGDARTYGWSRGLRITRPEGWHRRLRDRNERAAPLMATYVDEPDWFNYLTVPLVVPVTDMRGRTVTFTCRTYLPLTGLAFAHYLTRSRGFKRRFGVFDTTRITFSNNEGDVIPMMLPRGRNGSSQFHRVGLRITYAPPLTGGTRRRHPTAAAPPGSPSLPPGGARGPDRGRRGASSTMSTATRSTGREGAPSA